MATVISGCICDGRKGWPPQTGAGGRWSRWRASASQEVAAHPLDFLHRFGALGLSLHRRNGALAGAGHDPLANVFAVALNVDTDGVLAIFRAPLAGNLEPVPVSCLLPGAPDHATKHAHRFALVGSVSGDGHASALRVERGVGRVIVVGSQLILHGLVAERVKLLCEALEGGRYQQVLAHDAVNAGCCVGHGWLALSPHA